MRFVGLAALALAVFVISAIATLFALLFMASALVGSCGENCYDDYYLGVGVYAVALIVPLTISWLVVRQVARMTR